VGEAEPFIRYYCDNCGYKSTVSESYAGKTIRCPKCYNIISIPTVESTGTTTSQSSPGKPEAGSQYSDYDLTLLDISEK
jgi:ribosomal protein S27E